MNKTSFETLAKTLIQSLYVDEELSLSLEAEDTFYMRLNQGKVRQTFKVNQGNVTLRFVKNQRYVLHALPFGNDNDINHKNALAELENCRQVAAQLPPDPFCPTLMKACESTSCEIFDAELPTEEDWFDKILPLFKGKLQDCAGLLTSGRVMRAVSDSLGQNHWFSRDDFNLDLSFYTPQQKAVKFVYTNHQWLAKDVEEKLETVKQRLDQLDHHNYEVKPGQYRTYFEPQAVAELVALLSPGAADYYQGSSAFQKLAKGQNLSSKVILAEDFSIGLSPRFNSLGETAPLRLDLIEGGKLKNWLTSTRTAKEHDLTSNYAEESEGMRSAHLMPGTLDKEGILSALDTGLYVSNLHYLNWSDLNTGRLTSMTRYACFWVEKGQIKAPIQDLRFDESFYHFLGDGLVELTNFVEKIPDTSTYDKRAVGGVCVPGMLVNGFNYTL